MTQTIQLTTHVPANREIKICLPKTVPVGPADLTVTVAAPPASTVVTLGVLLAGGGFGLWLDREDLGNGLEFARGLRSAAWKRPS